MTGCGGAPCYQEISNKHSKIVVHLRILCLPMNLNLLMLINVGHSTFVFLPIYSLFEGNFYNPTHSANMCPSTYQYILLVRQEPQTTSRGGRKWFFFAQFSAPHSDLQIFWTSKVLFPTNRNYKKYNHHLLCCCPNQL